MTERRELLVEIGTEELPPLALKTLSQKFAEGLVSGLEKLDYDAIEHECFATPRRLGVLLKNVPVQQEAQLLKRRGPITKAAYTPEGKPTKAAEGFAKSCGISVDALEIIEENGSAYLYFESMQEGKKTEDLIIAIIEHALMALPIPKRMRWGEGAVEFIRPVHWVAVLYAGSVIEGSVLGLQVGRQTFGHRVYCANPITIGIPEDYETNLYQQGKVVASYEKRRKIIAGQINELAKNIKGVVDLEKNQALLDEVTALVEWPVAIMGSFEESYLDLPAEVLIMSMKENQKYFPVFDANDKLTNRFIAVSNIASEQEAKVRTGNERVLRPRLADANFFWQQDKKEPLEQRLEMLKGILFQSKLGSLYDKSQRISALAEQLAVTISADLALSKRAGLMCKADLVTNMVGEFPKLQGTMGRYYALEGGETKAVALALEEHYWPRYAGDHLPSSKEGQCVAIADKIDTLMGIFAAGEKPTGDKDPYALRRAAIGVIKIIIDCKLDLDLADVLAVSARSFPGELATEKVQKEVLDFILNRLHSEYESMDFTPQQIQAVLASRPTNLLDFDLRVKAVKQFEAMPEAVSLSAANKRIRNILKKSAVEISHLVQQDKLLDPLEQVLHKRILAITEQVAKACDARAYEKALKTLSSLRGPVDEFFDGVMVMTDDIPLRLNRLALLAQLQNLFLKIADISLLQS